MNITWADGSCTPPCPGQPNYDGPPCPCRRRSPGGYPSALPASSGTAKLPSTPPPAAASSLLLLVPARRKAPSQLPPTGGVAGSTPRVGAEGCDGGAAVAAWQSGIAGGMHALSGSAKTSQLAWHAGAPSQVSCAVQPTDSSCCHCTSNSNRSHCGGGNVTRSGGVGSGIGCDGSSAAGAAGAGGQGISFGVWQLRTRPLEWAACLRPTTQAG